MKLKHYIAAIAIVVLMLASDSPVSADSRHPCSSAYVTVGCMNWRLQEYDERLEALEVGYIELISAPAPTPVVVVETVFQTVRVVKTVKVVETVVVPVIQTVIVTATPTRVPGSSLKVAFIADTDIYNATPAVFELIKNEGVDMVLHQGDGWNADDWDVNMPDAFEAEVNGMFGPDFPFYMTIGNHDVFHWGTYEPMQAARVNRTETNCVGEIGVKAVCTHGDLTFLMIDGLNGEGTESFITEQLAASESKWKVCLWHALGNSTLDLSVRAVPFDACRKGGAFIVRGDWHAYVRTHGISDFSNMTVASEIILDGSSSFLVISGVGGASLASSLWCMSDCTEWASSYTEGPDGAYGALFITFYENEAVGYFKTTDGEVIDNFTIRR